jgi:hypothetical protein
MQIDSSTSQRTLNERDRPETQDSQMSIDTTRSTLQRFILLLVRKKTISIIFSVIRGVGEMDVYNNYKNHYSPKSATPKTANSEQLDLEYDETPYLIVDLRDIDEFNTNHIVSGNLFMSIRIIFLIFIQLIIIQLLCFHVVPTMNQESYLSM